MRHVVFGNDFFSHSNHILPRPIQAGLSAEKYIKLRGTSYIYIYIYIKEEFTKPHFSNDRQ